MSVALVAQKSAQPPTPVKPLNHSITKQQKAAILLSVLIEADSTPDLDQIATESLKKVVDTMASFGEVDRHTVDLVILEFLSELQDYGLSMRSDLEDTLSSLKGHLDDETIENIRKAYILSPAVDVWVRVASASATQLQNCLADEHIQVAAVVLSKIPSVLAAEVLGGLDPARARETMMAIINSKETTEEIIKLIGTSISETLFETSSTSDFDKPPVERAGDIMNYAESTTRERLMEDFGKSDPEIAKNIRKAMFTPADIPTRVNPRDASAITRAVTPEILLKALKNAPTETDFLLSGLTNRIAEQLREDLAELPPVKTKDAESAMNELIAGIRQLEANGEITLITEEPTED